MLKPRADSDRAAVAQSLQNYPEAESQFDPIDTYIRQIADTPMPLSGYVNVSAILRTIALN